MFLCYILKPHHTRYNSSLSYYGNFRLTIVPYAIGIVLTSYYLFKASAAIAGIKNLAYVRRGMQVFSAVLLLILLTPFSAGLFFFYGHIGASAILALTNLFLVFYCTLYIAKDWQSSLLTLVNVFGVVGCVLSLAEIHILHYEAVFELVTFVSLGFILARTLIINSAKHTVEGKI